MLTRNQEQNNTGETSSGLYTSLIFISLLLTLCTVVLSSYIRLAQSGLDCSVWPDCYGHIGTVAEGQGITVLTQAGAEMSHKGARLVHRFVASTLGITISLILLLSIKRKISRQPGLLIALLLMGTTLFLAILGYNTPSRTLPWVTLGNLGGGMLMLALLWWLGQRSLGIQHGKTANPISKIWPVIALALLSTQILSGAWVSANFAATACDSSILCQESWASSKSITASFALSRELSINEQGTILLPVEMAQTISLTHRILALICMLYLAFFAYRLIQVSGPLRTTAIAITLFLFLQMLLGTISVYYQLSLALVTLHNLLAALLLLSLTNALQHIVAPP